MRVGRKTGGGFGAALSADEQPAMGRELYGYLWAVPHPAATDTRPKVA